MGLGDDENDLSYIFPLIGGGIVACLTFFFFLYVDSSSLITYFEIVSLSYYFLNEKKSDSWEVFFESDLNVFITFVSV